MADRPIHARLARLQELQAANRAKADARCEHQHGTAVYARRLRSGELRLYTGCATCQAPREGGRWLPHDAVSNVDELEVAIDERYDNPPCARCGAFGTELHHFAPRHLFGAAEADLWPTAWLCQPCHDHWHHVTRTGSHAERP